MKETNPHAGGCSFIGILTVVFAALKITGIIDWPWIWILSPIWIYAALVIFIALIAAVVIIAIDKED